VGFWVDVSKDVPPVISLAVLGAARMEVIVVLAKSVALLEGTVMVLAVVASRTLDAKGIRVALRVRLAAMAEDAATLALTASTRTESKAVARTEELATMGSKIRHRSAHLEDTFVVQARTFAARPATTAPGMVPVPRNAPHPVTQRIPRPQLSVSSLRLLRAFRTPRIPRTLRRTLSISSILRHSSAWSSVGSLAFYERAFFTNQWSCPLLAYYHEWG